MGAAVTGIVLCGGSGRRTGGEDKPLLPLENRPLVAHVLERLTPQVDQLVISANRNLDTYDRFGHPVVTDVDPDTGPLAGILAAATHADSELFMVCPGDAPLIPLDLVSLLLEVLHDDADVVVPHDGERLQHLFMLIRRVAVLSIADYLAVGQRSVRGFLDELRLLEVSVTEPRSFYNVNTLEDLQTLQNNW